MMKNIDVIGMKILELKDRNRELLEELGSIMVNYYSLSILPSLDKDARLSYPGKSIQKYTEEVIKNRGAISALSSLVSTLGA